MLEHGPGATPDGRNSGEEKAASGRRALTRASTIGGSIMRASFCDSIHNEKGLSCSSQGQGMKSRMRSSFTGNSSPGSSFAASSSRPSFPGSMSGISEDATASIVPAVDAKVRIAWYTRRDVDGYPVLLQVEEGIEVTDDADACAR